MPTFNPDWTAPQTGHDWRDDDVQRAVDWLKQFVPATIMQQRLDQAKNNLNAARDCWAEGKPAASYNDHDTAAWYILQGETFATNRQFWVPEEAPRIVPFLTRLGRELDLLKAIPGAEVRAERLMTVEKRQPQSGIYELLVGLAYKRHGWVNVDFVAEQPGIRRTPDIYVSKPRSRWAVECKRLMPPLYVQQEQERGRALAAPVHTLSLELGRSLAIAVVYKCELASISENYLVDVVRQNTRNKLLTSWNDHTSFGYARDVDWALARRILSSDDVYFGSSRMVEIITGKPSQGAEHSFAAKWRPSKKRPFYAEAIYQASVVSWRSESAEADNKKSRHFQSVLAKAESQLPSDRPGVIHVGVESRSGFGVDGLRHLRNYFATRSFTANKSRLRWVYGNYFVPEITAHENEMWAVVETMAPYKIGSHSTKWPLPGHMLIVPEDEARTGVHWDGRD